MFIKMYVRLPKKIKDFIWIRIKILETKIELAEAVENYNNDPSDYNELWMRDHEILLGQLYAVKNGLQS